MHHFNPLLKVIQMKPKRKRTSPEQFSLLSESFNKTDTPNYDLREKLAKQLDMTNREVQVSFKSSDPFLVVCNK
jgi:hypothetical protein